jgi:hypothetical protein
MSDSQWQWLIQALIIISKQVNHQQHTLDALSEHLGSKLPPELVQAGQDLADKRKILQAALDAQAKSTPQEQQPIQKEPSP